VTPTRRFSTPRGGDLYGIRQRGRPYRGDDHAPDRTGETFSVDLSAGRADLRWTPLHRAAAVRADRAVTRRGRTVLATAATAFDVLENWLQAPRYGFLSQFEAGRSNIDATMSETHAIM